ncbi:MAG: PD-(D/E)XK nuclease family protein [Anaerolineae bacterium]|nr:PD-(D/E)XK nuclease family protein [Anaerolineae bacterium]
MNLPDDFVFSQTSLQDYVDCARRFELRYLLRQRWPAPEVDDMLEFEARMDKGEQFHHLVHQHLAGIDGEVLLPRIGDEDVRRWFDVYLKSGLDGVPEMRRPETTITTVLNDTMLLAKFDLLAVKPGGRALIVDWKTSERMPSTERLAQRLQTIVYRYVLAASGEAFYGGQPIPPEQIEMVYWYADHEGATQRFPYDAAQYATDTAYLAGLIEEIASRPNFPLTPDVNRCRFCPYRSLCDRGVQAGRLDEWDDGADEIDLTAFTLDIDQIAEIEY